MEDAESPSAGIRSRPGKRPARDRPARERTSRLEAAAPLFFFAAVALAIAYFNYTTGPHSGGRLPLWMLFVAVGTIVAGGGVASLVAPETDEEDRFQVRDNQSVVVPRREWQELRDSLERYRRLAEERGRPAPEIRTAPSASSATLDRADAVLAIAELERTIRASGALETEPPRSPTTPPKERSRRGREKGGTHPAQVARRTNAPAVGGAKRARRPPLPLESRRPAPVAERPPTPPAKPNAILSWRESVSPELAKLIAELYPETASADSLSVPAPKTPPRTTACAACGEPAEERDGSERCDVCGEPMCEVCVASALLEERPTRCRVCRAARPEEGTRAGAA